ncbi:hypothetical protein EYF80_009203 [Liparis tanakae]|uniref:Uncharacterized protein n=1 Tax=Liparis tanakae TaxID=230148 RepID=A0A4Z2ISH1_9TELE|nr:hypothetical protein EYF80_009203 [Liparis tanakae]
MPPASVALLKPLLSTSASWIMERDITARSKHAPNRVPSPTSVSAPSVPLNHLSKQLNEEEERVHQHMDNHPELLPGGYQHTSRLH